MNTVEPIEEQPKQEKNRRQMIVRIAVIAAVVVVLCLVIGLTAFFVTRNNRTVTITYYTDVADLEPVTIRWGEVPTLPALTQEGYEFGGWYTEDGVLVDDDFFAHFDYLDDLDLHVAWIVLDPVTVTYMARGGTGVEPLQVPRGSTKSVAGQTERKGFYLLGWCFDEQCLNMYYPEEYVVETDLTLYAKWLPRTLGEDVVGTVNYNTMGGVAMESETMPLGQELTLTEPHREGFTFIGWYSDKEYTCHVDSDILLTQSCVLYARWAKSDSTYTISFVSPDGAPAMASRTYAYDAVVRETEFTAPYWDEHTFVNFYQDDMHLTKAEFPFYIREDHTYYLSYVISVDIRYAVTFVLFGDTQEVQYYSPGATIVDWTPYRSEYVFDGWYADADYTHAVDLDTRYAADGLVFYAKWIAAADYVMGNVRYEQSADGTYVCAASMVDSSADTLVIADTFDGLPVREIKGNAFYGRSFSSVQLGANVREIGENAFSDNNFLTTLNIPQGVAIGREAFARCSVLESVLIEGRASIGACAFADCINLLTVTAQQAYDVSESAFAGCRSLQTVDITYVEAIGVRAFYQCESLTEVRLANGTLAEVPTECFYGCSSLTSIDLPSSVKTIFYKCFERSGLTIFDTKGITKIYSSSFAQAESLQTVKIRADLVEIEQGAFVNNTALTTFSVDNGNAYYRAIDGSLYNKAGTELIIYAGAGDTCTIGAEVTAINLTAFLYARRLKTITVSPDNATYSSVDGVLYSKDGKTLYCYPSAREDDEYAVADGTVTVNSAVFAYAEHLQKVTLPDSVTTVAQWAFYELPNLMSIECLGDVTVEVGATGAVYACPQAVVSRAA